MTTELLTTGTTWFWLVALHSFLMGLVFFAWTRVETLAPGRSRRWLLAMILVFPIVTATLAMLRRDAMPETVWFDSRRLLNLTVAGGIDAADLAIMAGGVTLLVTAVQEVIPSFFSPRRVDDPVPDDVTEAVRNRAGWDQVEVIMIEDHLAAATGGTPWRPKLYLSTTFVESMDHEQLEAVILHERAHMAPRRWWTNNLLFLARMIQAPNPVALWVSREYAVENELDCDREAVESTPETLAKVLFVIYEEIGRYDSVRRRVLQRRIDVLLGRSPEAHRVEQLPPVSLLIAGGSVASLLCWVV